MERDTAIDTAIDTLLELNGEAFLQLLNDFFTEVDRVLQEEKKR